MSAAGPQFHAAISAAGGTRLIKVRRSIGDYVDGRWLLRDQSDVVRRLLIRKISPSDLKLMPEGARIEDSVSISTSTPMTLEATSDNAGGTSDRVLYAGWWWRVVAEVAMPEHGRLRYLATREDKAAEEPPT